MDCEVVSLLQVETNLDPVPFAPILKLPAEMSTILEGHVQKDA